MKSVEYPYPVLQSGDNDYREGCTFEIVFDEARQLVTGDNILLTVGYSLKCPSLERLIREGKAEVFAVVHSPAASYRRIHTMDFDKNKIQFQINKFEVIDNVQLQCMIVASDNIAKFKLEDFNSAFFGNTMFNLEKGSILAITETVVLYLDDSELEKPVTSIFNINRRDEQQADLLADFSSDTGKIEIDLSPRLFELYGRIEEGYANSFRRCLTGTIVLPVLVEAIDVFRSDFDSYIEHRWARIIAKKLDNLGISIEEDDVSSVHLADMLLGGVIGGSLDAYRAIIEEKTESEEDTGGVD